MTNSSHKLSKDKVWLGVIPTLWWNDDFINIDIGIPYEQALSEMALAGYVGCGVGHKYPTDPKVLRPALELRGLRISEPWVSTYFTIEAMKEHTLANVDAQLDFLEQMEQGSDDPRRADLVVSEFGGAVNPLPVALFPNCPNFDDDQWKRLVEGLHEAGRKAQARDRKLCYHPHLGTGVMKTEAIHRLMDTTEPNLVHMLLDTAHQTAAGVDALALTRKYASRIKHVHLKDIRRNVVDRIHSEGLSFQQGIEAGIFTVPGDGDIKTFPEILSTLADAGFTGWICVEAEQDPAKANPLQYAKMGRAYLRELLGW
ncbi:myo-inosose-2 dehydratase [Agrobacterium larrymoorei]|uniref:Myo-inosose-2 dehydratase n=1 Tax=Agrobacterium larrymoorei TaxID=160699 RepID=A0AAF0HBG0_9HYPH|nr:myo-inosose-2 dehydratase [Agrobacterium larrymoorei]WHA44029.1 myo-inosose-2 dehydratase [Agrobacterium larrymoorei]